MLHTGIPTSAQTIADSTDDEINKIYPLARGGRHLTVQHPEPSWDSMDGRREGFNWLGFAAGLIELDLSYEEDRKVLWQYMAPEERPSFTPGLIADMNATIDFVDDAWRERRGQDGPIDFLVLASRMPGIFNLGGDLPRFLRLIQSRDADSLRRYAHACVDGQHRLALNLNLPLCTVALVQGDALGGGFEAALAHNVIIAERSAKFGLPEILFNLFPGMGAYTFLAKRLDPARAERLILSGRVYSAEEMYAMGVVDELADDGDGIDACYRFIDTYRRTRRTRKAVFQARQIVNPVSRDEMFRIADLWVESALDLDATDLRKMQHLAKAQDRRWSKLRQAS